MPAAPNDMTPIIKGMTLANIILHLLGLTVEREGMNKSIKSSRKMVTK
jgi:hypothetical protein